jgi:hypothetical protein
MSGAALAKRFELEPYRARRWRREIPGSGGACRGSYAKSTSGTSSRLLKNLLAATRMDRIR